MRTLLLSLLNVGLAGKLALPSRRATGTPASGVADALIAEVALSSDGGWLVDHSHAVQRCRVAAPGPGRMFGGAHGVDNGCRDVGTGSCRWDVHDSRLAAPGACSRAAKLHGHAPGGTRLAPAAGSCLFEVALRSSGGGAATVGRLAPGCGNVELGPPGSDGVSERFLKRATHFRTPAM